MALLLQRITARNILRVVSVGLNCYEAYHAQAEVEPEADVFSPTMVIASVQASLPSLRHSYLGTKPRQHRRR